MAEFATRWTDDLVREYLQFDANADGVITPKECLAAREAGAVFSGETLAATRAGPSSPGGAGPARAFDKTESTERRDSPPMRTAPGDVAAATTSAISDSDTEAAESSDGTKAVESSNETKVAESSGETKAAESSDDTKAAETSEEQKTDTSSEGVEIPEAYLKYAISYIRMHDTDGNGMLTTDEWEEMRKSPQSADRNGDGRVTPQEYAQSMMKR